MNPKVGKLYSINEQVHSFCDGSILLILLCFLVACTDGELTAQTRTGEYKCQLISIDVHNTALESVLHDLATRCELRLELQGTFDEPVTAQLDAVPLTTAVKQLLRGENYMLFTRSNSVNPVSETPVYTALWVYSSDGPYTQQSNPAFKQFPVSENPADVQMVLLHGNKSSRLAALDTLLEQDGVPDFQMLTSALYDVDAGVREELVEALGDYGGAGDIYLLEQALYDKSAAVREAAVFSLGEIGGREATQLLQQVADHGEENIRVFAHEILDEMKGDSWL